MPLSADIRAWCAACGADDHSLHSLEEHMDSITEAGPEWSSLNPGPYGRMDAWVTGSS